MMAGTLVSVDRPLTRICVAPGCQTPRHPKRGRLCLVHAYRWKKYGDYIDRQPPKRSGLNVCVAPGCERLEREREGLGLCRIHAYRWRKYGNYDDPRPLLTLEEQLLRHVKKTDACWLWTGHITNRGYGLLSLSGDYLGQKRYAHRLAYEVFVGPIPDGLHLDHLCCVPLCVNPAHLEPVTNLENARRRYVLKTHCKRGHEFTPENTRLKKDGRTRICRACARLHSKAGNARRRKGASA